MPVDDATNLVFEEPLTEPGEANVQHRFELGGERIRVFRHAEARESLPDRGRRIPFVHLVTSSTCSPKCRRKARSRCA
jgi:hypothetical protein